MLQGLRDESFQAVRGQEDLRWYVLPQRLEHMPAFIQRRALPPAVYDHRETAAPQARMTEGDSAVPT